MAFGESAAVLRRLASEPIASACWRRTLAPDVVDEVRSLRHGPAVRRVVPVDDRRADAAVLAALEAWAEPFPQALARDLRQLLALHALLCPGVARRLRFERLVDDGCRRFHADHVSSRLICTYAGPGTECLPASAIDPQRPADGSNDHVLEPDAVWRCTAGWVLLMRGTLGDGPAQFHRSPPRDPAGPRLLAAIDG
ncbi:DUF1826 domain-containing protein [Silanimonas sp.]|uniref:DUF1826 domain-containing protein n=1 Tax=Silanimonas sp. TaxID=1929290 RepID=UPI00261C517B|nr:DUF1826 domain-containing protein [Silanimonas sp.]